MDTKIQYQGTKLRTSNFIFWCLKGFQADFELPEYDFILDNRSTFNGVIVDPYIPLIVVQQILSIPNIKVLEAGQGKSSMQPTYLIIQLHTDEKEKIFQLVNALNGNVNIKCNFEYDPENKIHRIGITTNLYVGDDPIKFKTWWNELPNIITNSIIKLI